MLFAQLNAKGGIDGRTVVPVYHAYDGASTETIDQQGQEACARSQVVEPIAAANDNVMFGHLGDYCTDVPVLPEGRRRPAIHAPIRLQHSERRCQAWPECRRIQSLIASVDSGPSEKRRPQQIGPRKQVCAAAVETDLALLHEVRVVGEVQLYVHGRWGTHGYPKITGRQLPVTDLFRGISDDVASGFMTSAALIVVLAAAMAMLGAVLASRLVILLAALASMAVLIDWITLEAVHRAPGDFVASDLRAGTWLVGAGSILLLACALTPAGGAHK